MKLKVIGWTYYEDDTFPVGELTWAAKYAVLDDVVENGYVFTGYHHQELDKCVPVLNNGKRILFTQRGFGGMMAEAHGYRGLYDYSLFTYTPDLFDERYKLPTNRPRTALIESEETLLEEYTVSVDMETFARADLEEEVVLPDLKEYRFLSEGDRITLVFDKETATYNVTAVERKKGCQLHLKLSV